MALCFPVPVPPDLRSLILLAMARPIVRKAALRRPRAILPPYFALRMAAPIRTATQPILWSALRIHATRVHPLIPAKGLFRYLYRGPRQRPALSLLNSPRTPRDRIPCCSRVT